VAIIPVGDSGNVYTNGNALHTAIASAGFGDRIQLVPGVEYRTTTAYTLTDKGVGSGTDADFIFIETNNMALLPAGQRVGLAHVAQCAHVTSEEHGSVIYINPNAHHWWLQGLDITTSTKPLAEGYNVNYAILGPGPGQHHITLDRCVVHPLETAMTQHFRGLQRGVTIVGANIVVSHSSICEFAGWAPPLAHQADGGLAQWGFDYRTWIVSAATNANPCVLTLSGTNNIMPVTPFPLQKRPLAFEGCIGTGWSTLNTTLCADRITDTTVSLQYYDPATGVKTNVDSTTWPAFATSGPGGVPQPMIRLNQALNDASGWSDSSGPGPVTFTNSLIHASTYCLFTGGGATSVIEPQNDTTVTSTGNPLDQVTLAELGDLAVGDVIAFEHSVPQAISAATNGAICRITVPPHRYIIGSRVISGWAMLKLAGFTGAGTWATLNSAPVGGAGPNPQNFWWGKAISATEIDLYHDYSFTIGVNTSGFGAYTGGATWQVMSYLATTGIAGYEDDAYMIGRVTEINTGTKRVTYDFQGVGGVELVMNGSGNGAGLPVAVGSKAQHHGLIPRHYTLQRCTLSQSRWMFWLFRDRCKTVAQSGSGPKGVWENKSCTDVLIEGCILEVTGGLMGTDDLGTPIPGSAISFNQVNQVGQTPWVDVSNWMVRYNLFRNGMTIFVGHVDEWFSSKQSQNFTLIHNLFTSSLGDYFLQHMTFMKGLIIRHNTVRNGHDALYLLGNTTGNVIMDNVYNLGEAGYNYNAGEFPPYVGMEEGPGKVENNYIIDNKSLGAGAWTAPRYAYDHYVASATAMQFTNLAAADAGGDYHGYQLASGSPGKYTGVGTGSVSEPGKDVGVNFALLDAALAGSLIEEPPPPTPPSSRRGGAFHNQIFRVRF
jgi:hypothetical protein